MAPPKVYKKVDETKYYLPINEIAEKKNEFYLKGMCIVLEDDGNFFINGGGIHSSKITMDFEIPDALKTLIENISDDIIEMKRQGKTDNEISDAIVLKYQPRLRF